MSDNLNLDPHKQLLFEIWQKPEIELVGHVVKIVDLTFGILYIKDEVWPCVIRKRQQSRVYVPLREEDGSIRMRIHDSACMVWSTGGIEQFNLDNEHRHFLLRIEEITFDENKTS